MMSEMCLNMYQRDKGRGCPVGQMRRKGEKGSNIFVSISFFLRTAGSALT